MTMCQRAARALLRAPAFTATATLTLGLGVGVVTLVFALVDGILLERFPVRSYEQLVLVSKRLPADTRALAPFGATSVRAVRDHATLVEGVAPVAYNGAMEFVAVDNGVAHTIRAAAVGGAFFRTFGTDAVIGRTLRDEDDIEGASGALVITDALWRRLFGSTAAIVGRRLNINDVAVVIVGVVPDVGVPRGAEAWMTLHTFASTIKTPAFRVAALRDHNFVARVRRGATVDQVAAEVQAIASDVARTSSDAISRDAVAHIERYEDAVVGDVRAPVLLLFVAVCLVLVIAAANVTNLMLLRGEARRGELAVRMALGASRSHQLQDMLLEAVILGTMATVAGALAAWWSLDTLLALSPTELPRLANVQIDARVLAFAGLAGVGGACAASVIAALAATRLAPGLELGAASGRLVGGASRHGRRALVVSQVAASVVIVASAGVLTRTLLQLEALPMGMATEQLVFVELALPADEYPTDRRRPLFERLMPDVLSIPGVEAVSPLGTRPFAGLSGWNVPRFFAEGQTDSASLQNPSLNLEAVHPEHFATLGIRLQRGRGFRNSDTRDTPNVTIVSADLAARTWPGQDPIGKRLKMGGATAAGPWFTVVGVADPVRYRELQEPPATMYVAAAQFIDAASSLAIRTSLNGDTIASVLRDRIRAIDGDVHVVSAEPFSMYLARPLARPRFIAVLSNTFGVLAVTLAAVGLYGVLAAFVRQSMREIGVRIALGATGSDIRRLVAGEAARLTSIGVGAGALTATASAGTLRGLVFGVAPVDPIALVAAVVVLSLAATAACYVPLRRALRVDAVTILRSD
jgi:putative ABC transport system permease protein